MAFRSRDGSPINRLKRFCIHGTYFTQCAWCRLSPTPPGGPSEGHGFDGGAGAVRGGWRRRPHSGTMMGDGARAEDDAPAGDDRDEAEDEVEDSVGGDPEKTPFKKVAIAACTPW
jgi:hypothetical protein